jgi:peptide/nickel transport system substrate-binding protein
MITKSYKILFVLILLLGLFLVACSGEDQVANNTTEEEANTANEESNEAEAEEVNTEEEEAVEEIDAMPIGTDIMLDPALASDEDSLMLASYLYDTLVATYAGVPGPSLALNWTISEDQLHYTVELTPNITFWNGEFLTSDIVVANFERWFDPNHPLHGDHVYPSWESFFFAYKGEVSEEGTPLSYFDGIEKVDQLTFIIHLNQPSADFLYTLSEPGFSILFPESLADGDYVGTGPYTIGTWEDSLLELVPNESYWDIIPSAPLYFEQQ